MFERVKGLSDGELRTWDLSRDLVAVRLFVGKGDEETDDEAG